MIGQKIGFIGGGIIIFNDGKVRGLTSASIIWMSAAAGALCGINMYREAIMSALTIVTLDLALGKLKQIMSGKEEEEE